MSGVAPDSGAPDPSIRDALALRYDRYRPLVDDWEAFLDALARPLPRVVWPHPRRIDRDGLAALLAPLSPRPLAWHESALALPSDAPIGHHVGHWAGLFYVQEAASMLPVRVLDPRPGDRVLDLCAAPGSKTAQIALALRDRGTVVANDRSAGRHAATSAAIARLGLRNVTCTVQDGARFPLDAGTFDKVLVDAPCSAEGSAPLKHPRADFRERIARLQTALLARAARLCRAGGRIVYSTCTLAPEENELVIEATLRACPELRLVPIAPIEGLDTSPGIETWEGRRVSFDPRAVMRTWPHRSGTGGFFVALLEKDARAEARDDRSTSIQDLAIDARESEVLRGFCDRFGIAPEVFDGLRLLEQGRFARLVADDHRVPHGVTRVSTGLTLTRNRVKGPKLSTPAALAFGRDATRQLLEVSLEEAAAYQRCEALAWSAPPDVRPGYVLVRTGGHPVGLAQRSRDDGRFVSEFPTAWARAVT